MYITQYNYNYFVYIFVVPLKYIPTIVILPTEIKSNINIKILKNKIQNKFWEMIIVGNIIKGYKRKQT